LYHFYKVNLPSPPWFYNASSNLYYAVELTLTDQAGAQAWCSSYDGSLFTIQSSDDLTLLQNIYSRIQTNFWVIKSNLRIVSLNKSNFNLQVGAYAAVGMDFRWISTNESVAQLYWYKFSFFFFKFNNFWYHRSRRDTEPGTGQPDEPCVQAGWSSEYRLNDIHCSHTAAFLCERR
jgi:hypothetical protein